jgi:hypothetical protein
MSLLVKLNKIMNQIGQGFAGPDARLSMLS